MGNDLPGIDGLIGGCHGRSTGEDEDAEAEQVAEDPESAELRHTEAAAGFDKRHN
jgi:hypothetical protein